jgi:hypothetical protein
VVFWNCSDSVVFWNCSDSVVFWNCSDIVVFWNCSDSVVFWNCSDSVVFCVFPFSSIFIDVIYVDQSLRCVYLNFVLLFVWRVHIFWRARTIDWISLALCTLTH